MGLQTTDLPNSDIPVRYSWVRVVFCFRDSAKSFVPSEPISLSGKKSAGLHHGRVDNKSTNYDIRSRFRWVSVVFCFRDSANACAPSEPIKFSEKQTVSLP